MFDREENFRFCYGQNQELFIHDFDGDGRDDLLCHDKNSGIIWVSAAAEDGTFQSQPTW